MNCDESIEILSDFHDGELNESGRTEVSAHLAGCGPCAGLYSDLDKIVLAASGLRGAPDIPYPDEEALWQRMGFEKGEIH
jgi:anti-sigma factor RsiW